MYGGDLPTQMLYCYGFYQPLFDKMERTIKNFTIVFSRLKWPPFFANYSLMVILIEKLIREMNLDIYRVIEFIFSTLIWVFI